MAVTRLALSVKVVVAGQLRMRSWRLQESSRRYDIACYDIRVTIFDNGPRETFRLVDWKAFEMPDFVDLEG